MMPKRAFLVLLLWIAVVRKEVGLGLGLGLLGVGPGSGFGLGGGTPGVLGVAGGGDEGGEREVVEVLIWSGGSWAGFGSGPVYNTPNYLGHSVVKPQCPVDCRYTGDKSRQGVVDGIILEAQPLASYGDRYLREPIPFPQKRPGQYYINFGYEQQFYFPLYADPDFLVHADINMTYDQNAAVQITFTCSWGGGDIGDFLAPPKPKTKGVAFMSTNCGGGGASYRTVYIKELMKHLKVDSLGGCLHNTDLPESMRKPIYDDHGTSQRWKIQVFSDYKYVLTFENNNVTDYVTEKLPASLKAGTLPIYMGAPNIEDWLPGEHSIINTADFANPKELADYIHYLDEHDEEYQAYFEWKKKGLSPQFKDKYEKCVFYGAECRLCTTIAAMRAQRKSAMAELDKRLPPNSRYGEDADIKTRGFALNFDGSTFIKVPHDEAFSNMAQEFTICLWIKPGKTQSMRLVDKNTAGIIDGISLDLQFIGTHHYVRLCAGYRCVLGTRPLSFDTWYYVSAVFSQGDEGVKIYLNGFLDVSSPMFAIANMNSLPLHFGSPAVGEGEHFVGKMDDISLWSIALEEAQIKKLAFTRMAGNEIGLLGYWSLNEGGGNIAHDWSYSARHGEIVGSISWEDAHLKPLALNPCW